MEYRELTWTEFEAQFEPVENEYGEYWLETFGSDWELVKSANPANVFTIIDGGGRYLDAVSGCKFVNRLNYVITTNPAEPGVEYYVTNQKAAN